MKYAKLINNSPSYAPNPIIHNGLWYGNPPGAVYEAEGYKIVTYAPQPEAPSGYYYQETWAETEGAIVQGWELVKAPEPELSADEALDILLGGAVG